MVSGCSGKWGMDLAIYIKPTEADKDGIIFPAAKAEFRIKNEYYMVQSD